MASNTQTKRSSPPSPSGPPKPRPFAKFSLQEDPKNRAREALKKEEGEYMTESLVLPGEDKTDSKDEQEKQKWDELVDTLRLHRRRLLRIPGVTAVDVGYKLIEKENKFLDELALRVHVERKLHPDCLKRERPEELIDPKNYLSPDGNEVTMDVIEAEYRPLQMAVPSRSRLALEVPRSPKEINRRRRLDPLVGGISIGSPEVPVGTLGALVWDRTDGSVCILSNWHVLSGDVHGEAGNPCFQPGRFDQGRSSDVVARLKRWSFDNQSDAAIAELTGSRRYCAGEIVEIYQQISGVADPYLGMEVLKSGRSTGATWGFVDGLYFSAVIQYSNGIVRIFEDQIHIAPQLTNGKKPAKRISEPGDSGSVWVARTNGRGYRAVGLHFAGDLPHSAFGEYALANPMSIVAERLNFSFRPLFLEIRDEDVIQEATQIAAQPLHFQNGHRNGIQPSGFIEGGRLNGSGSQPVSNTLDPGGSG